MGFKEMFTGWGKTTKDELDRGKAEHEEKGGDSGPTGVHLEDGTPLYHVLLETSDAGVAKPSAAQEAKSQLVELAAVNESAILNLEGKSSAEAAKVIAELRGGDPDPNEKEISQAA